MVTALFALSLSATAVFAQKGVEDGSRFGHGEDSLNCLKNISIYTEYVKTNNFQDAFIPWKAVFDETPWAQVATYTNGAKILRALIATSKDGAKQKEYFDLLMKLHDQRIQYLDQLNGLTRKPTTKGDILATKAHDFYSFMALNPDINAAYAIFKEAVDLEKQNLPYYVMQEFADVSGQKIKSDETHKEQFIQDYIVAAKDSKGSLINRNKEDISFISVAEKYCRIEQDNPQSKFLLMLFATLAEFDRDLIVESSRPTYPIFGSIERIDKKANNKG